MAAGHQPEIGDWYMTPTGDTFEVVAYDPEDESVEIQYFDGAIEELDLETWLEVSADPIEPPEDWSGSMDVMREDYGLEDRTSPPPSGNPLDDPEL
ncbi:DUF6763 family protein [Arhodomonas sp. AD133]|uniref:DUF6763 family protein n=1 Tax=Arhodomonas sp. AD133 TaxID=3415009 RepID=UPI003EBDCADD